MPSDAKIAARLRDRAAGAPAGEAAALEKAAKKLESYSRSPGSRKDAERMAPVLTPAVVDALGEALVALRADELANPPHELIGPEFRQADHALGALLVGASTSGLREPALARLEEFLAMVADLPPKVAEHVQYLARTFDDVAIAQRLHAAATARLGDQPETVAERWARELGLDMPAEYWSMTLHVPLVIPEGARRAALDAAIFADVKNFPGNPTQWNLRIGALSRNRLGEHNASPEERGIPTGQYRREDYSGSIVVEGAIAPAESPDDFPRVLADLERAHPELRFDLAKLSVTGGPGRLGTAARKKALKTWLGAGLQR